jgi:hypothetical protein
MVSQPFINMLSIYVVSHYPLQAKQSTRNGATKHNGALNTIGLTLPHREGKSYVELKPKACRSLNPGSDARPSPMSHPKACTSLDCVEVPI